MDGTSPTTLVVVLIGVVIVFVALMLLKGGCWNERFASVPSKFHYLGSVYRKDEGGSRGEPNEECLQSPGYRFCMLTDGTSGVCALSGMCVANMLNDLREERDDIRHPLCTKPIFKEGCKRHCDCLAMKFSKENGRRMTPSQYGTCLDSCISNFHPSPTFYPL